MQEYGTGIKVHCDFKCRDYKQLFRFWQLLQLGPASYTYFLNVWRAI